MKEKLRHLAVWLLLLGMMPDIRGAVPWQPEYSYRNRESLMQALGNWPMKELTLGDKPVVIFSPTTGSGFVIRYLCVYHQRSDGNWSLVF